MAKVTVHFFQQWKTETYHSCSKALLVCCCRTCCTLSISSTSFFSCSSTGSVTSSCPCRPSLSVRHSVVTSRGTAVAAKACSVCSLDWHQGEAHINESYLRAKGQRFYEHLMKKHLEVSLSMTHVHKFYKCLGTLKETSPNYLAHTLCQKWTKGTSQSYWGHLGFWNQTSWARGKLTFPL